MGTYTGKFNLYKPDGVEFVDVGRDLNANWNKLAATGSGAALESDVNSAVSNLQNQINALEQSVFGATNLSKVPACKISKNGTQNIPNTTITNVLFGQVDWETKASMSDLAHEKIIVPNPGIYLITFQWCLDPSFSGEHRGWIYVGTTKRAAAKFPGQGASAGAGFAQGQCSYYTNASADTEIGASIWHNGGSGIQLSNAEVGTFLAVVRVADTA